MNEYNVCMKFIIEILAIYLKLDYILLLNCWLCLWRSDVQLCDEYEAIQLWALRYKMIINASNTKEIIATQIHESALIYQQF